DEPRALAPLSSAGINPAPQKRPDRRVVVSCGAGFMPASGVSASAECRPPSLLAGINPALQMAELRRAGCQQGGQGNQAAQFQPARQATAKGRLATCRSPDGMFAQNGIDKFGIEQITPARQRLDDAPLLVAENLPQHIDLLVQTALADHPIGPAVFEQLLTTNNVPRVLQQALQHPAAGVAQLDALFTSLVAQLIVPRLEKQAAAIPAGAQADEFAGRWAVWGHGIKGAVCDQGVKKTVNRFG